MTPGTTTAPLRAAPETPSACAPHRPSLKAIMRRLAVSLSVACVVPAVMFYVALVTVNITAAVVAALTWSYAAIVWRWATKRPLSGLLILTVSILTIRTAITLSTGDTFVYFLQPVVSDALVSAIFLVSLVTARPVVARLASDFYPIDREVAGRPRIRRLFWHLTLLWALVSLVKGGVGFWLLESQSLLDFVLIKNILVISLTVLAVSVTVWASTYVARKEGLITRV
jgi:intracellular septation protein A